MMNTVVGIDLGTQSLKVLFYDFAARECVAVESAPLDLHQSAGGVAEQQADWWLSALRAAVTKVPAGIRRSARAIAVSGQQHGLVAVDASDNVLVPVKLWCDTSTSPECEEIMDALGGREGCIERAGNPILPGYTASKVRRLAKAMPSDYARMDCILLPHDYVNLYLTGERCMEMGDASGTGFLDIRKRKWSSAMLQAIDPDRELIDCLPTLRTANESIGCLRQVAAKELGLPARIPIGIGGGDNMMGAVGTGNVRASKVTISLGTSGTVYAYSDVPIVDPKGNVAAFCSSTGGWLPLLCTMNCTVATELMRNLLHANVAEFEKKIAAAPRGAGGAMTLPFFNGERTPDLPHAKGCIVGLGSDNMSSENLLRSAVEGATYSLRFGIDELASLGVHVGEIVLTGGGAKSDTWRQLVADICDRRVVVLEQDEGAAFGAALQALQVVEPGSRIEDLVEAHLSIDATRCCEPGGDAVRDYKEYYRDYQRALSAIAQLYT